jgi:hypothetical protein
MHLIAKLRRLFALRKSFRAGLANVVDALEVGITSAMARGEPLEFDELTAIVSVLGRLRNRPFLTFDDSMDLTDELDDIEEGLFDFNPTKCQPPEGCCLGPRFKRNLAAIKKLEDAIPPDGERSESTKRRQALRKMRRRPTEPVTEEMCRHLGDAIFGLQAPPGAVILTTNTRDHGPLARALGLSAERPDGSS